MSTGSNSTSLSLLEQACRGNELAWSELVPMYQTLLIAWCRQLQVPRDEVPDVVQEVFLQAYRKLATRRHASYVDQHACPSRKETASRWRQCGARATAAYGVYGTSRRRRSSRMGNGAVAVHEGPTRPIRRSHMASIHANGGSWSSTEGRCRGFEDDDWTSSFCTLESHRITTQEA